MEEAPRGTFQDELEWCISQLETGLLHLHPTPEQAEESQRILRVLRSHKAPSVKKRQVMHRVFGDYRLKMAEERKRTAKAAVIEKKEATHKEVNVATAGGSSKRKKRRKQPSKVEPGKNVNEDSRLHVKAAPDQTEVCQQPEEQVKREVEWCVEQLELGLKTQKSTPKQREEALRAIKTLRSEKAVLAKKRQIMRLMFGDYRKKMAGERQKQLKFMQTASKAARIAEVPEDARQKSSRVFRKSMEVAGNSQNSKDPFTRTANTCSFRFTPSQEEFQFNFF